MTAQLKVVVVTVVAAALLAPVASAGKGKGKAKNAVFKGTVVSLDRRHLTVEVLKASKWGRGSEGRRVAFFAGPETRIRVPDRDGDGQAELSDFRPDDGIQVIARVLEGRDSDGQPGQPDETYKTMFAPRRADDF